MVRSSHDPENRKVHESDSQHASSRIHSAVQNRTGSRLPVACCCRDPEHMPLAVGGSPPSHAAPSAQNRRHQLEMYMTRLESCLVTTCAVAQDAEPRKKG